MGTFTWPMRVSSMDRKRSRDVEAMVDTGAFYTTLPGALLRELGVEPTGRQWFEVADGRVVPMDIGRAWVMIDGEEEITLVAFGPDNALTLLGAYTLEGLRLAADPTSQRLVPIQILPL